MADANVFLQQTHHKSDSLLYSLDPLSLILSQNSATHQLKFTTESFSSFERGPRYEEYAQLRDSRFKVRHNFGNLPEEDRCCLQEEQLKKTPIKKQVSFGDSPVNSRYLDRPLEEEDEVEERILTAKKQVRFRGNMVNQRKAPSFLAQSVPDFSAMVRKENRRPTNTNTLPRVVELTPPTAKTSWAKNGSVLMSSGSRGSKSASAGEKRGIGMARKSYANVEDLRKISMAAARDINLENRRKKPGVNRTVLGNRQFY